MTDDLCPICELPLTETVITHCEFSGVSPMANEDCMHIGSGTHLHGLVISVPRPCGKTVR